MKLATTVIGSYPVQLAPAHVLESMIYLGLDPYLDAIRASVKDQLRAGVEIVSDGQTRGDMIKIFTDRLLGLTKSRKPVITGRIDFVKPITLSDLRYAKSFLKRGTSIKGIISGPYTLAMSCENRYYKDRVEAAFGFAEALNKELKSIQSEVSYIQVDEPFFSVEYPRDYAGELMGKVAEGISVPIGLHVCGDTRRIFPELIDLKVDILSLEFKANPSLLKVVKEYSFKQKLGYGSIDSKSARVESVGEVKKHVEAGLRYFEAEKLIIHPDCGLRNLSREAAFRKLSNMVKAVKILRETA